MYEPATVDFLSQLLAIFFGTVFSVSFLIGSMEPRTREKPRARETLSSYFQDEQDVYAILSGDEEYLAAHVTLKQEPVARTVAKPKPKPKPKPVARTVAKPKPKPKPKPKATKPSQTSFGADCASSLVALGYKKLEAKKLTDEILSRDANIKDIDSFIKEAFKK